MWLKSYHMISEGIELMVVGMGVVFTFLVLLVVFMNLCGAFFTRFSHLFAEPEVPAKGPASAGAATTKPADSSAKLAVALAAAHRTRRRS
jgi:oxaloacetate decarboxylase gamma subunit